LAQGTVEDYQRASRFETGEHRHLLESGVVLPHWIEKTSRFWYRHENKSGTKFILVDAAQNTSEPAFDQARLATALSQVTHHEYQVGKLPFDLFEYADDGKAITFHIEDAMWTCKLASYECERGPDRKKQDEYEEVSPNDQWAAFVKDYNLYLRNVSTGQVV